MFRNLAILSIAAAVAAHVGNAEAYPQFLKAFRAEYLDGNENEDFTKLAKKAKCMICHAAKEDNPKKYNAKEHNPYGQKVDDLLGKGDRKDADKISKALQKIAEMPSREAKDGESEGDIPTFGELIEAGKLPGGDLPGGD
ncbi:MAG: hypothetical protein AAF790_05615 [Planctomycetota bacterium]